LRPLRQHRKRRVISHRAHGFLRVLGHRKKDHFFILKRIAEDALAKGERLLIDVYRTRHLKEPLKFDPVLLKPAPVGPVARDPGFNFVILNDALRCRIHQKHLARSKHPLFKNVRRIQLKHADFGGHHHLPAFCDDITGGP